MRGLVDGDRTSPGPPYTNPRSVARRRFGGKVFRVAVDAGFSCPVRDGTRATAGCLFCSIDGFRPPASRPKLALSEQVRRALPGLRRRYPAATGYLVYLQPYTSTHGPPERLAAALAEARHCPGALGIVVGTRPDALPGVVLDLLAATARETYLQVELGVQSTDDATLRAMRRGHTWAQARRAIALLKARGLHVGAHMILGTPWEPAPSQIAGARRLSAAGIDAVKLHHLQVLRGSALASLRHPALWSLPSWRTYAQLAADFLEQLDARVVVERLCAVAPRRMLLAPRWGVRETIVRAEICRILRKRGSRQGTGCRPTHGPRMGALKTKESQQ